AAGVARAPAGAAGGRRARGGAGAHGGGRVSTAGPRRGPALLALAALLVAGVVAAVVVHAPAPAKAAPRPVMPTAGPASALSSTWYCPLATADKAGQASGTIVVSNPARTRLSGTIT